MAMAAIGGLVGLGTSIYGGISAARTQRKKNEMIEQRNRELAVQRQQQMEEAQGRYYNEQGRLEGQRDVVNQYYGSQLGVAGPQREESRGLAADAASNAGALYDKIANSPGFTDEEREQIRGAQQGLEMSPELRTKVMDEIGKVAMSPQEEAAMRSLATAPVGRTFDAATSTARRTLAARGNYGPGMSTAIQQLAREKGRSLGEAALGAEVGISRERTSRATGAAGLLGEMSDRDYRAAMARTGSAETAAQARRADTSTAASGALGVAGTRSVLSAQDLARMQQLESNQLQGQLNLSGQMTNAGLGYLQQGQNVGLGYSNLQGQNLGVAVGQPSPGQAFGQQVMQGASQFPSWQSTRTSGGGGGGGIGTGGFDPSSTLPAAPYSTPGVPAPPSSSVGTLSTRDEARPQTATTAGRRRLRALRSSVGG